MTPPRAERWRDGEAGRAAAALLAVASVLVMTRAPALAGGPLLVGSDGKPRIWSTSQPVVLNPDRGPLGGIVNPVLLVDHAVNEWNSVGTAALRLEVGESLANNIERLSAAQFDDFITRNDGTNPILFDSNGAIFDAILGQDSNVLAIAGPSLVLRRNGTIIKGYALFNGEGVGTNDFETEKAVVTHEVGHILNLDHAQINGIRVSGGVPGFSGRPGLVDIETMFPVLIESSLVPHPLASLAMDDRAAFSALYPTRAFADLPVIRGRVLDIDGTTLIQGVNVIARNVEEPFADAVSYVTGTLVPDDAAPATAALLGSYELRGLNPGKRYAIGIEEIFNHFTAGSSVGPLDPPADLDRSSGAAFLEFFSGVNESERDPPDDPSVFDAIPVRPGETRTADIIFNGVLPRVEDVEPSSGSYLAAQEITILGINFGGALSARLLGPSSLLLGGFQAVDRNTVQATVPAGLVPGHYRAVVATGKGASAPSELLYRVTEPRPVVFAGAPETVENDRDRLVTVTGQHLLGARSAELEATAVPTVAVEIAQVISAERLTIEVPAGVVPGAYRIRVTNTAGRSEPSAEPLLVVELAPALTGTVEPPAAGNGRAREVHITGENLSGTNTVELVLGAEAFPVTIVSTSLEEIVVNVPGGLPPGTYDVRVTNSASTTTGPATFTVTQSGGGGGGGGGGCSAVVPGERGGPPDFPLLLLLLVAAAAAARRLGRGGARGSRHPVSCAATTEPGEEPGPA